MILSNKDFLSKDLHFEEDKLFFIDDNDLHIVMSHLEIGLMDRTCDLLVRENDDFLEIGFGMGLFSDYAQSKKLRSHTIIEGHPQVFQKLLEWAKNKDNVIPIFGDWFEVYPKLLENKYDSVYLDTHYDSNQFQFLRLFCNNIKKNGRYSRFLLDPQDKDFFEKEINNTNFEILTHENFPIVPDSQYTSFSGNSLPICILIKN